MKLILPTVDLTEASNIPQKLENELPRDHLIRSVASAFGPTCQIQVLKGGKGEGKTNTLAQFARYYPTQVISYFVTEDPQTRRRHYYLQQMCQQMSLLLRQEDGHVPLDISALESRFSALCFGVQRYVRQHGRKVYWVLDGLDNVTGLLEEEKIIDILPSRFPQGPYLLMSWPSESISELPAHILNAHIEKVLPFSINESRQYFANCEFTQPEVDQIHQRHGGNPGSLAIIRKAKETNGKLTLEEALKESEKVLSQQIEYALMHTTPEVKYVLGLLAVSPAPLPVGLLTNFSGLNSHQLNLIAATFHLSFGSEQRSIWFDSETARHTIYKTLAPDPTSTLKNLVDTVKQHYPEESFLITLLLQEAKDYEGITHLLTPRQMTHELMDSALGLPNVVRNLRVAAELAAEKREMADLLKWSLSVGAVRSFSSHALNTEEIEALIAIGESSEALRRVYAISDITTRIRLLANTYSAMQDSNIRVSISALDELKVLVESLSIDDLDPQLLENLSIDLFVILPESAIALLERLQKNQATISIFDSAIQSVRDATRKLAETNQEVSGAPTMYEVFKSKWINATTLEELYSGLDRLSSTRAKEEFIRRWCVTNRENEELVQAVDTWLDVIIEDAQYTVPIKSLRQICELVTKIQPSRRAEVINRLHIPEFLALRAPKQEWVRIRFALAEAQYDIDPERAQVELHETLQIILGDTEDLDVHVFCLARALVAVKRVYQSRNELLDTVTTRFNESLFALLNDSADHLDHLGPTINLLVEYDFEDALVVITTLNTEYRRNRALFSVLRSILRKYGQNDICKTVQDIRDQLSKRAWDSSLVGVLAELFIEEKTLHPQVLQLLSHYVYQIDVPSMRVYALLYLAALGKGIFISPANTLQYALDAWKKIEDLKLKLATGYDFVKLAAPLDREFAATLLQKIKELNRLSGAPLASGSLGATYAEYVRLGLRALTEPDIRQDATVIERYVDLIEQLPSPYVKLELFGMLTSALLRCNHNREAHEIMRTKMLVLLDEKLADPSFISCAIEVLPVIYEYDPQKAAQVCDEIPRELRSNAWLGVILWLISRSFLGDQNQIEVLTMNLSANYRCLRECAELAMKISHDIAVFTAVQAICRCARTSFDQRTIDAGQVLDILEMLDRLAMSNLPDPRNFTHLGYRVLAQSRIHALRSYIWVKKQSSSRGLSKTEISRRWQDIRRNAENIQNRADRVLVLTYIAEDMCSYYTQGEKRIPHETLETAERELAAIPTAQDRLDRMEALAQSWHTYGKDEATKYLLQNIVSSFASLENLDKDEQLSRVIQLADSLIGDEFASELAARVSGNENAIVLENVALKTQKALLLRKRPNDLNKEPGLHHDDLREIISLATKDILSDVVSGKGRGIEQDSTIQKWLYYGTQFDSASMVAICKWIVEGLHRGSITKRNHPSMFFELCGFVRQLAELAGTGTHEGIPDSLYSNFPGLSSRYVEFRSGEREQAQKWLAGWLKSNANKYLKIVDPYFGIEQLAFLNYVPDSCKTLIITTNTKFEQSTTPRDLQQYWNNNVSSRSIPYVRLMIVPKHHENALHDRVIISQDAGIDLGCSLNTLGNSAVKMALLPKEEAQELDSKYVQKLLDATNWLLNHDVDPVILVVGDNPVVA
jgi:hypothetical protein